MSFRTVANVKDDLSGMLHGTNANSVTNINGILARAGRHVLTKIDPAETLRRTEITIYDGVEEYTPPSDLKDRKVSDFAQQVNRGSSNPRNVIGNDFERQNLNDTFRVVTYDGEKVLKLKKRLTPAKKIFAHFNDNEGWAADGTGLTSLEEDTLIYAEGGTSLKFNKASGQTTGNLTTSTISSIDLSDYEDIAGVFLKIWLPNTAAASALTTITLRWGSSASAYWEASATTPHNRDSFKAGWNLVRFDWPTSATGTPDASAVDYARIELTTSSGAINAIRIDDLFFSIGKIIDFDYYSNCIFSTTAGAWRETPDNDDTLINLDTTGYDIFLYEAGELCFQQSQAESAAADRDFCHKKLHGDGRDTGLYDAYLEGNPNEAIQPRTTWY